MTKKSKRQLVEEIQAAVRLAQNRTQAFDELVARRLGINTTDLRCLDIIQQEERATAGRIAERAGLTSGAVTGVIDRLEKTGYARRVADPEDRRRVIVELTDAAAAAATEIYGPFGRQWAEMFSRYTADELQLFLGMMNDSEEVGRRQLDHLRSL